MAKKVYTLTLDEKNLQTSASKKTIVAEKSCAQKEVEEFGIVEINNAGATKKAKNKNDAGYAKVVNNTAKKQVKENIHKVDDYFDFSFRPETKTAKLEEAKAEAKVVAKTAKAEKPAKKTAAKAEKTVAKKTTKVAKKAEPISEVVFDSSKKTISATIDPKHNEDAKSYKMEEVSPERAVYDDAACYNISVARMGALFDCEKRMLN